MKFLKAVLPNFTVALNLAFMIVIYLDMRNPMMGFLVGAPFRVLAACCCICSIATALVLYGTNRRNNRKKQEATVEKQ